MFRIEAQALDTLLQELKAAGYQPVGPRLSEGAIIYEKIESAGDLPEGWRDHHEPGKYSLHKEGDGEYFGYSVGPHSFKKFLFPPKLQLFSVRKDGSALAMSDMSPWNGQGPPRYAFIGMRACEIAALEIQDKVFTGGQYVDQTYSRIRTDAFIVAVDCLAPGGNCFCTSTNTGPSATSGFDLGLTELTDNGEHFFLVQVGTGRGENFLRKIPYRDATAEESGLAMAKLGEASGKITKRLETEGLKDILSQSHDNQEWEKVGKRCLSCANCTMVCPTCFCSTVRDTTDLAGDHAERWREWDSCFSLDFARVSGGNFRPSAKARYRQWLTHKLGSWHDQFGTSGCVGCGRCITWCPVGIDITEEVHLLRTEEPLNEGK